MGRATFGDLYADHVERHPRRAARALVDLRKRLAELDAGATPRFASESADGARRKVESYLRGFRMASRCELCGTPLEDPESKKRGIGPECWRKVKAELDAGVAEADSLGASLVAGLTKLVEDTAEIADEFARGEESF